MSLKHGLLGFLSGSEYSGYDLEKMFRSSLVFFWNAKISQVYRDLHAMERQGWVESIEVIQRDRPSKKVYRITDSGQGELQDWLTNYDTVNDFEVRVGILMRMFFAAKRPTEETIALLEQFCITCRRVMETLQGVLEEVRLCAPKTMDALYSQTTLSYGLKYYQMQIDWCNETITLLKNL